MYESLDHWLKAELHGFAPAPTQKEPAGRVLTAIRCVGIERTSEATKAKAAEALRKIHILAEGLLRNWDWHDEAKLPLEGCVALRPRQAQRAIELHEDIADFVVDGIKGCGGVPMEFLGILEAIKDFVYPLGWECQDGWGQT